jgi:hypothetical protein
VLGITKYKRSLGDHKIQKKSWGSQNTKELGVNGRCFLVLFMYQISTARFTTTTSFYVCWAAECSFIQYKVLFPQKSFSFHFIFTERKGKEYGRSLYRPIDSQTNEKTWWHRLQGVSKVLGRLEPEEISFRVPKILWKYESFTQNPNLLPSIKFSKNLYHRNLWPGTLVH